MSKQLLSRANDLRRVLRLREAAQSCLVHDSLENILMRELHSLDGLLGAW